MCYRIRPLTMFDTEHTHDIRVINHMKFVCKQNQIHIYTYGYFVFIV